MRDPGGDRLRRGADRRRRRPAGRRAGTALQHRPRLPRARRRGRCAPACSPAPMPRCMTPSAAVAAAGAWRSQLHDRAITEIARILAEGPAAAARARSPPIRPPRPRRCTTSWPTARRPRAPPSRPTRPARTRPSRRWPPMTTRWCGRRSATRLADLAPGLPAAQQDRVAQVAWDALARLAEDVAEEIRATIAEAVKDLPQAPRAMMLALAHDTSLRVAEPVIRLCPLADRGGPARPGRRAAGGRDADRDRAPALHQRGRRRCAGRDRRHADDHRAARQPAPRRSAKARWTPWWCRPPNAPPGRNRWCAGPTCRHARRSRWRASSPRTCSPPWRSGSDLPPEVAARDPPGGRHAAGRHAAARRDALRMRHRAQPSCCVPGRWMKRPWCGPSRGGEAPFVTVGAGRARGGAAGHGGPRGHDALQQIPGRAVPQGRAERRGGRDGDRAARPRAARSGRRSRSRRPWSAMANCAGGSTRCRAPQRVSADSVRPGSRSPLWHFAFTSIFTRSMIPPDRDLLQRPARHLRRRCGARDGQAGDREQARAARARRPRVAGNRPSWPAPIG